MMSGLATIRSEDGTPQHGTCGASQQGQNRTCCRWGVMAVFRCGRGTAGVGGCCCGGCCCCCCECCGVTPGASLMLENSLCSGPFDPPAPEPEPPSNAASVDCSSLACSCGMQSHGIIRHKPVTACNPCIGPASWRPHEHILCASVKTADHGAGKSLRRPTLPIDRCAAHTCMAEEAWSQKLSSLPLRLPLAAAGAAAGALLAELPPGWAELGCAFLA